MFDWVPFRVWLLIVISLIAFAPARYLYHHAMQAPARRDITQPPIDVSWRTSRQFMFCLVMLVVLIGLAIFIFTPAAVEFANSPSFWPILFSAFGAWAFYELIRGAVMGSVEPLVKGNLGPFERTKQPWRYWASMLWNGLLAVSISLLIMFGEV